MKAKKLFVMYGKYSNTVTYEYKGKQYNVEYAKDPTYCVTPAWVQHRDAQAKIDKMLNKVSNETEKAKVFDADEVFAILGWD